MELDEIKKFVRLLVNKTRLPPEYDDEPHIRVGTDYVSVSTDGLRYSTTIKIETNTAFQIKMHDYLTDVDVIDIRSTLSTIEDFQPYWEQVATHLKNQQPLPTDYVKYPTYRTMVFNALEILADEDYQQQAWIHGNYPDKRWGHFTDAVNWLEDVGMFAFDDNWLIGYVLRTKAEVLNIKILTQAIDKLLDKLGNNEPDTAYLKDPDWKQIVKSAKEALRVMEDSD